VKKAITGSGRAEKDQVARMVAVLVGLKHPQRADAADALALAITHAHATSTTVRLVPSRRSRGDGDHP
jgi:crossover junction endodeoxyribonuclease RuvC